MISSYTQNHKKEYLDHIRQIFDHLNKANLKLKLTKVTFLNPKDTTCGQLLSKEGISTLPKILDAIKSMQPPKNIKGVR